MSTESDTIMQLSIGDKLKSEGWELMVSTNYALVEHQVYLHAITENSRCSIYIEITSQN